jgi:hypothetical protein
MNKFAKIVLLTGLFVAATDIMYAFVMAMIKTGHFPEKMFLYLAGGALGLEKSMQGGVGIELLGLFFHLFISMSFTLFFFLIFPKLKFLSFNKYMVGMLYGIFVNLAMRFIIMTVTPLPQPPFNLSKAVFDWILFGIVFGIPIVYNTYKYYSVKDSDKIIS